MPYPPSPIIPTSSTTRPSTPPRATPSRPPRWPILVALILLQLGALAVVLVAAPFKQFELDRFFVPKELALHIAAVSAGLLATWGVRRFTLDRVDTLLLVYTGISAISATFTSDHVASVRALAVTCAGIVVFWTARAIAGAGLGRLLVIALATAVVVGAGTGLLQAYGLQTDYASLARAPGGTFGNRNFMAHLAAVGAPLLLWSSITSKRTYGVALGVIGSAMLGAALVLSRSRAAWLALALCGVLMIVPTWLIARRVDDPRLGPRGALLALAGGIGVLAALALPNQLNWKSDSPYLDSVRGVVDYSSGSGKGRLIQYKNTLRMAMSHPVLGVGPGNWPRYYPTFASKHDPSLSRETGRPSNPWPSSDWIAMIAERGPIATLAFLLAYLGLFVGAWRREGDEASAADQLAPVALMATLLITATVGAFDAVLLLGAPTLIAWSAFGALSVPGKPRVEWAPGNGARRRWLALGALLGAGIILWNVCELMAMSTRCAIPYGYTLDRCRTVVRGR